MYLEQKIKGILGRLGPSFDDDIGFELKAVKDGVTEVGLVLGPKACVECIVPDEILEAIILTEIRKDLPMIRQVKLSKPANKGD